MRSFVAAIRLFLVVEAIAFGIVSLIHAQVLAFGAPEPAAATAEGIIAVALVATLALTWLWPAGTRGLAIAVHVFAIAFTLLGMYLNIRFGSGNPWDVPFHVGILLVMAWGLVVALRGRAAA
ncbi:MAG: hypothetical protein ACRDGE_11605 [Candidatus Limnocylindria bacterium]